MGIACGTVWGVAATAVFMAMFRGLLPAPGEVALPLAIGLVLVYFPFQVAVVLENLLGHSSPSLVEIVGITVACGAAMGLVAGPLIVLARRALQG